MPAIERVVKCWGVLKNYFQSLSEDDCPKILWEQFGEDEESSEMHQFYLFQRHAQKKFFLIPFKV